MRERASLAALALAVLASVPRSARGEAYHPDAEAGRFAGIAPVGSERLVLRTELGDLVLALYPTVAPGTVAQITKLARAGVYDGTHIYRVEPSFVVQLSVAQDRIPPLTPAQQGLVVPVPLELSKIRNVRGTVQMARNETDKNGGESSFSVILCDAPHLDGKYVVFGHLEWGYPTIEAIRKVERDARNVPVRRLTIERAFLFDPRRPDAPALRRPSEAQLHPPPPAEHPRPLLAIVLVMMALGLASFLLAGRVSARTVGAFGLLVVLTGFFYLYAVLLQEGRRQGGELLAVGLFFGSIGLFKLLSRFETVFAPPPPSPESPRQGK